MKKLLVFIFALFLTDGAYAASEPTTLITSCPSGYIAIYENNIVLANSTCPAGYVGIGTATSCLVAYPAGECWMYAPTNTDYADDTGTYEFNEVCPLT
jgi:hypothetical protein